MGVGSGRATCTRRTVETAATGWFEDTTGMMVIGVLEWLGSTIDQGLDSEGRGF